MNPFTQRFRVYWEDTDAGGVVYHANYLKFFERARTEWLRAMGFSQKDMASELGTIFVVTDANLGFRAPARLDDQIDVSVSLEQLGGASLRLRQRAVRDDNRLLAEGEVRVACVDAASFAPKRLPRVIVERLGTPSNTAAHANA